MRQMKMPNLESLVSGFEQNSGSMTVPENISKAVDTAETEAAGESESEPPDMESGLWVKFQSALNIPREKKELDPKLYKIDSDIIETINQCGFKVSTTQVVNTILKVFLLENLDRLNELRKLRPSSLFDKYLTNNRQL